MSCAGKVFLSVAILAVCLQAAPVAKRRDSNKFTPARCPEAKTGKFLVILEFEQPSKSSEQRASPSFVFTKYLDTHLVKEDDQVKEEQPTKAEIHNQVSVSTDQPTTGSPTPDVSDDKKPLVNSYTALMPGLIYHVDMNDPALQGVLDMSEVFFVEEESSVTAATSCNEFGSFGNQEDDEPEPTEDNSESESQDSQSEEQPMMMMMG